VPRAVFLDRDGVINEDRDDYVKHVGELKVFAYVPEAIRRLNEAGYEVVVISNQQGVAKGLIAPEDLRRIEDEIERQVEAAGARIAAFYYCTHLAQEGCSCRKPQPGLILRAARERSIDLTGSVMVGDTEKDVLAGKSAGCRTVLLLTGAFTRADLSSLPCRPDFVADDLRGAADYVVALGQDAQKH
jgi:D-glycero-D-manno-heptose 1,7-bisphosphate phosphatase